MKLRNELDPTDGHEFGARIKLRIEAKASLVNAETRHDISICKRYYARRIFEYKQEKKFPKESEISRPFYNEANTFCAFCYRNVI